MHGQTIGPEIAVQIPLLFKVNKDKREVEGIATQEVKDVHGQIVDHESMKKVLLEWPGNIREMHQAKAVGKAVSVVSDDEQKATIIRARISKGAPDTWEKVLDGTLSMYSIGGTGKLVTTKHADGSAEERIFMTKLHETSLVDNGACPTAKFEIVKSVDGQSVECMPADEGEPDDEERQAVRARSSSAAQVLALLAKGTFSTPILKGAAEQAIAALTPNAEEPLEKRAYPSPYMIDRTLAAISCLESILADEYWRVYDTEAREEDASTDRAQLQILRAAIELVLAYLVSEFGAQFEATPEADDFAMARRAAVVDGVEKALPMVWGKVDGAGQLWFAKRGARHSKADTHMIQAMHDTAITLGAACAKAEEKAVVTTPEHPVTTPPAAPESTPADPQKAADQPPAAPVPAEEPPVQPTTDAVTPESVQKLVAAEIQKALEAQQATVTAQAATIADLTTRVEKLALDPAPGGPKTRATTEGTPVHKTIGNQDVPALEGLAPDVVLNVMTDLAKKATSSEERERLTAEIIKFQHRTGVGAMEFRSAPAAASPAQPADTK